MTADEWQNEKERSKGFYVIIGFDLLHSDAYRDLNYGPSLKALTWFHEKIKLKKNKRSAGRSKYERINGKICFLYEEAVLRGLSRRQFSTALQDLFAHGFIDIIKPGSGRRGDFTEYDLSQRWRDFGKPGFKELPFPRSFCWVNYGFGSKERRRKRTKAKCQF